ncbi:MAG: MerR family transcriptional regulator [Phycisphaerales bacterium]|nr:MerR family transcriptional regulator [Phycisphaerales bacterium]
MAEAARTVGLSSSALRFYEREGILKPSSKSAAGYRLYDRAALNRLRFVRAAQSIGLPLKDIRALMELDPRTSRSTVHELLESRLRLVDGKLKELKTVRDALSRALARCRRSGECCDVLVSLSVGASADTTTGDRNDHMHCKTIAATALSAGLVSGGGCASTAESGQIAMGAVSTERGTTAMGYTCPLTGAELPCPKCCPLNKQ